MYLDGQEQVLSNGRFVGACEAWDADGIPLPAMTVRINFETGDYEYLRRDSFGMFILNAHGNAAFRFKGNRNALPITLHRLKPRGWEKGVQFS